MVLSDESSESSLGNYFKLNNEHSKLFVSHSAADITVTDCPMFDLRKEDNVFNLYYSKPQNFEDESVKYIQGGPSA